MQMFVGYVLSWFPEAANVRSVKANSGLCVMLSRVCSGVVLFALPHLRQVGLRTDLCPA